MGDAVWNGRVERLPLRTATAACMCCAVWQLSWVRWDAPLLVFAASILAPALPA